MAAYAQPYASPTYPGHGRPRSRTTRELRPPPPTLRALPARHYPAAARCPWPRRRPRRLDRPFLAKHRSARATKRWAWTWPT